MNLIVTHDKDGAWLDWGAGKKPAAIGPGGIAIKGGEGDGITPRGSFPVREIFYRADRIAKPATALPKPSPACSPVSVRRMWPSLPE